MVFNSSFISSLKSIIAVTDYLFVPNVTFAKRNEIKMDATSNHQLKIAFVYVHNFHIIG